MFLLDEVNIQYVVYLGEMSVQPALTRHGCLSAGGVLSTALNRLMMSLRK